MSLKNKKILMVSTTDNMIWQFLIPHIKHLQSLGNTVECVCAKTGFWFDELKDNFNLTMHEINFQRSPISIKNLKGYKQLKNLQRQNNYDVIYCQQPVGGLMGRLLGKKFKLPVIYTAHGFHFFKGAPLKNNLIFKPIEKYLSKYTTALITINQEDYEAAQKMKAKNVYKINGIGMDFNKYQNYKESKEEIRKSLNIKNDEFVIVTVAEFIKRKNYPTMLRTIAELKNNNQKVKFLICGRGMEEQTIKNLIQELNIEEEVEILGYRKDINRILIAADLFFLTSYQEGLTLSVIEAMNYSLPCVVSNVRGNRDLINNEAYLVANANDYKQFAKNIEILMNNKDLREKTSNYNKKEADKYSIEKIKQQLEKIYMEI